MQGIYLRDYEQTFRSSGGRLVSLLELETVVDFLEFPTDQLILDVGTGTGRIARKLVALGNRVVGVDTNSSRLKLARAKMKDALGEKAHLYDVVVADGQHLPFKEQVFDSIVCLRVLKYFEDYKLALKDFVRTLKNRGTCCVEFSSIFGYEALLLFLYRVSSRDYACNMGSSYQLFNMFEVKNSLRDVNLVISKSIGWHRIPTIFFIKCKNRLLSKILFYLETALAKILPSIVSSRGILIKCELRTLPNE